MSTASASKSSAAFSSLMEHAARALVTVDHAAGHSFIHTPLMYPTGSSVVVQINDAGGEYFVTDFGMGYEEAVMMGASTVYARYAKSIASDAGIGFDSRSFFAIRVTQNQLPGAIATVANCSQEAATIATYRIADRRRSSAVDDLYSRLTRTFSPREIARDVPVLGNSNKEWHVAVMVQVEHHQSIFEPVSPHHASIYAAATKFNDISRVENAPARVAVVERKAELKDNLAVLSQSANVIERDASDETYQRIALAA